MPGRPASTTAARSAAASAAAPTSGPRRSTRTTSSGPGRSRRTPTAPAAGCATGSRSSRAATALVDGLLDLHTPRQLVGLEAILERIEGDLRAAPVEAALRLALLHALLPASRLNGYPGRIGTLRIQGGRVRPPGSGQWRERNPWLAFEDGIRLVRGFIQRLEGGSLGSVQARLGSDLRSLVDGTASAVLGVAGPSAARSLGWDAGRGWRRGRPAGAGSGSSSASRRSARTRSACRWRTGRTAWVLGREAASVLPLEALSGGAIRAPWGWQAAALGRSLAAVEPSLARDGARRVPRRRRRTGGARRRGARRRRGRVPARSRPARGRRRRACRARSSWSRPARTMPPGPRTRANVTLDVLPGGAGDPDVVPGAGLFVAPERFDRRPFSAADVARTVTEVAVETLKARGEPARHERLLGEILVGLDRAGQLRRLMAADEEDAPLAADVAARAPVSEPSGPAPSGVRPSPPTPICPTQATPTPRRRTPDDEPDGLGDTRCGESAADPGPHPPARPARGDVDGPGRRAARADPRRAQPDRPPPADRDRAGPLVAGRPADRAAAAAPLADRVEWAVFSLLSTAGPLVGVVVLRADRGAVLRPRPARRGARPGLPPELPQPGQHARPARHRRRPAAPDPAARRDDRPARRRRPPARDERLDRPPRAGPQARRRAGSATGSTSASIGPTSSRSAGPSTTSPRSTASGTSAAGRRFLFEVEWTAMLGEPLLRRHARIPPGRFARPLPRRRPGADGAHPPQARALAAPARGGRARQLARPQVEPPAGVPRPRRRSSSATWSRTSGSIPVVERSGEQMPLFEG